jgi:hypothetical protein
MNIFGHFEKVNLDTLIISNDNGVVPYEVLTHEFIPPAE